MAKVPTALEAPYIMRGSGGLDEVRGDQGGGRCWRRKREMAEVVMTRGIVAASVCNVSQNFKR